MVGAAPKGIVLLDVQLRVVVPAPLFPADSVLFRAESRAKAQASPAVGAALKASTEKEQYGLGAPHDLRGGGRVHRIWVDLV